MNHFCIWWMKHHIDRTLTSFFASAFRRYGIYKVSRDAPVIFDIRQTLGLGVAAGAALNKAVRRGKVRHNEPLLCHRWTSGDAKEEHCNSVSAPSFSYDRDSGLVHVTMTKYSDKSSSGIREFLFQTVVGIEVHAQLLLTTKLFSRAPTKHREHLNDGTKLASSFTIPANTLLDPFDLGYPGTLPSLSSSAVSAAVLSAHALNCTIHPVSRFERKHYCYVDLPLGYQVTQQRWPIATNGYMDCRYALNKQHQKAREEENTKKRHSGNDDVFLKSNVVDVPMSTHHRSDFFRVGIDRVQIEQDTGKTTIHNSGETLIDLNRAGCALIEIVFNPDIRSAHQAASALSTLQSLLIHVGTCDGKMEDGSLRCDLNVSIAPIASTESGHVMEVPSDNQYVRSLPPNTGKRVEVKNLNSVRQVIAATEFEALRQAEAFINDAPTEQETRTFDVGSNRTIMTRSKEGALDYRFMPEPDLPPLVLDDETLGGKSLLDLLMGMPELPEQIVQRLVSEYCIVEDVALVVASHPGAMHLYEETVKAAVNDLGNGDLSDKEFDFKDVAKTSANWLCNDLLALLKGSASSGRANAEDMSSDESTPFTNVTYSSVDGTRLGLLVAMVMADIVSTRSAKQILSVMFKEELEMSPREIADQRGWKLITDEAKLRQLCLNVVLDKNNQSQLMQYQRGGKRVHKMEKFFLGKVMWSCDGNAEPDLLREMLQKVLEEQSP